MDRCGRPRDDRAHVAGAMRDGRAGGAGSRRTPRARLCAATRRRGEHRRDATGAARRGRGGADGRRGRGGSSARVALVLHRRRRRPQPLRGAGQLRRRGRRRPRSSATGTRAQALASWRAARRAPRSARPGRAPRPRACGRARACSALELGAQRRDLVARDPRRARARPRAPPRPPRARRAAARPSARAASATPVRSSTTAAELAHARVVRRPRRRAARGCARAAPVAWTRSAGLRRRARGELRARPRDLAVGDPERARSAASRSRAAVSCSRRARRERGHAVALGDRLAHARGEHGDVVAGELEARLAAPSAGPSSAAGVRPVTARAPLGQLV